MKEKGMGRVRLGRFAAVTLPAAVVSVGLGVAMLQGAVSASLSSTNPFKVTAATGSGSGVELSLRAAQAAASQTDATSADKQSAFVTLHDGTVNTVCLAANQPTGLPIIPNIGLKISLPGAVSLGDSVDLNAQGVTTDAVLKNVSVGVAQQELNHQAGVANGANVGGFGIESGEGTTGGAANDVTNVDLANINADVFQVALSSIGLTGVTLTPTAGTATC
jgi:hypothetical protein